MANYTQRCIRCLVAGWGFGGGLSGLFHGEGVAERVRFECNACPRTFSNVYNLKVHVRDQHSGHGAIRCDVCGVHLKNLSTLRVHKSNYHMRCNECGEHVKNVAALAEHRTVLHGFGETSSGAPSPRSLAEPAVLPIDVTHNSNNNYHRS